jgi:hypothetical protein
MIATRKVIIVIAAFVLMALGLPWGGTVPATFAQTISVTAADPPMGEQGTLNLNVLIKGKGFKNNAKAKFYKTGTTDPAGINVKSTQFMSSTELVATIDIADAAALSPFDIVVQNADGRTGKGTELFSVVEKGNGNVIPPPSISVAVTLDAESSTIRPDGDPAAPYAGTLSPTLRDGTNIYDYYMTFWFRYGASDPDANRSVVFDFGVPRYAIGDKLACYPTEDYKQDRGKFPYYFPVPTFLTTGIATGTEEPLWVSIQATEEWQKDESDVWRGLGRHLDLGPYVNGTVPIDAPPRYVKLRIEFRTPEFIGHDVYAYVAHNGPVSTAWSFGTTAGLAEVTPVADGGFVLRPVSAEVLWDSTFPQIKYPGLTYPPLVGVNEANLTIKIPLGGSLGYKAWYAHCDAGTFNMPFKITFTAVR